MISRAFRFALPALNLFMCVYALSQVPTARPGFLKTVQICAEVRQLTGDPVKGLRRHDFIVLNNGTPLPFRLVPGAVHAPLSVLVIVSPASGFHTLQESASSLNQLLLSRHHVDSLAVLGPLGEYVDFQPVSRALSAVKADKDLYDEYRYESYIQAIDDLEKQQGRRAIVFLTNRLSNPPPDLITHAQNVGALIYAVGGNEDQNYTFSGEETSSASLGNYAEGPGYGPVFESTHAVSDVRGAGALVWENYAVRSVRTVYMEHSIKKAMLEIGKVAQGFYEIGVDAPASVQVIQLKPKIPGGYQFNAYACSSDAIPTTRLALAK